MDSEGGPGNPKRSKFRRYREGRAFSRSCETDQRLREACFRLRVGADLRAAGFFFAPEVQLFTARFRAARLGVARLAIGTAVPSGNRASTSSSPPSASM